MNFSHLVKNFIVGIGLFVCTAMQTISAQDSCWDCNVDSLKLELQHKKDDAERLKLLTLIVDLQAVSINNHHFESPASDRIAYIDQLLLLNKKMRAFDSAPYEKLKEAIVFFEAKDYTNALIHTKQAIDLFDQKRKIIVVLLINIRNIYNLLNKQEERFQFYTKKLAYYSLNGPKENTAPCHHGIGGYYFQRAEYNLAISHQFKAAEVYKNFYQWFYINDLAAIGDTYEVWGNHKKAKHYLSLALPHIRKKRNKITLSFTLYSLTKISMAEKRYGQAIKYTDEIINLWKNEENIHGYAIALGLYQKALVFLATEQPAKALPFLNQAKQIGDTLPDKLVTLYGELETDYGFYLYYKLINDYAGAERSLMNAYALAVEDISDLLQLKYLRELYHFYTQHKQPLLAQQYANQYFQLNDIAEQKHNEYKVANYEYERKELEQAQNIYALRQERAVQEAKLEQRNKILLISLGAFLLVSSLLIIIFKQLKFNKLTLQRLRVTQDQLILREKMASLGELTAGIAHEIQNPLNFVNNFSELSVELVAEMEKELQENNSEEVIALVGDLKQNLTKINFHGGRADAIVKGMLQHNPKPTGKKELTDLNALADEYLRLSYNAFKAKKKDFTATFETSYDIRLGNVEIVSQEIARVLLNLFNNAFYATQQKKQQLNGRYHPQIIVSTKQIGDKVEIRVRDNGTGISESVKSKVFQPFFTTKPTGEGTGLGLSLSYDIITKGHGGELKVESKEGEFTEFIIGLPMYF